MIVSFYQDIRDITVEICANLPGSENTDKLTTFQCSLYIV